MAKSNRGFASMGPEQRRAIASMGGRAAHKRGTAHQWDESEAAEAGRKGGLAVSKNRKHMAKIGRKGGLAGHQRGTAHEWTEAEAAKAGRKGARARRRKAR
jgi:general stress protein YciG